MFYGSLRNGDDGPLFATFSWNNDGDGDIPMFKIQEPYKEQFEPLLEYAYQRHESRCEFVPEEPWSERVNKIQNKCKDMFRKAILEAQIFNREFSKIT